MHSVACRVVVIAFLASWLIPQPARANEYEIFIDVESEEELYDLLSDGQIGETTFNTLQSLFQAGVDLNHADREELYTLPNLTYAEVDRILDYRTDVGHIRDPASLVAAGILTDEKLLAIAAYLVVGEDSQDLYAIDGFVRSQVRWSSEDARFPALGLRSRVSSLKHLTVGAVGIISRNRLGAVVADPVRGDALSAEPASNQLHVPKLYAWWNTDDYSIIAGTYRIGFGQRLTFDNSSQVSPNGIYRDDELRRDASLARHCNESTGELATTPCPSAPVEQVYVTPDFKWSDRMLGVAAGAKHLSVGPGHLQLYAFFSHQPKSIYQYQLYDPSICEDPRSDLDVCKSPPVYRQQDDLLAPTSKYKNQTLDDMYTETIVGANATFFADRRVHIGLTGYGSSVSWLVDGLQLDFQDWAATPFGGPFGAVGIDVAWGRRWLDVFMEASHSFDSMKEGGGGSALLLRSTASWKKHEIEAVFRYYDKDFANPHARPIAAADQFEGLRARDEIGARLRYTGMIQKRLSLRTNADYWVRPQSEVKQLLLYSRADLRVSREFRWGFWGQYQDKNLEHSGHMSSCFNTFTDSGDTGAELDEPAICAGQKISLSGRVRYAPKRWSIAGQLQHEWQDEEGATYDDRFRQDRSFWLLFSAKPAANFQLRLRTRYLFEDIEADDKFEESLWTYADFAYRPDKKYRVRLRYDLVQRMDERANTKARRPSPEQWLWFEIESKF